MTSRLYGWETHSRVWCGQAKREVYTFLRLLDVEVVADPEIEKRFGKRPLFFNFPYESGANSPDCHRELKEGPFL